MWKTAFFFPLFVFSTSAAPFSPDYVEVDVYDVDGTLADALAKVAEELIGSSKNESRGMDFEQFVKTDKCKANIARSCFDDIDTNKDGLVSQEELEAYDRSSMQRVQSMFDNYLDTSFMDADTNRDGVVDQQEADRFAFNNLRVVPDENWREAFSSSDANEDGLLDLTEFKKLMNDYSNFNVNIVQTSDVPTLQYDTDTQ
ncbi:unnamed protein product [Caenorhabditis auriculariae]|uniref:EF-hand domain-containing protein n=1 Tax=Caenorhabditis auriculariae TaxID=2777116 RepID=A0A8S1H672_9PELO|nr:unnamed protein product [Caenorhabditis auriculariae]